MTFWLILYNLSVVRCNTGRRWWGLNLTKIIINRNKQFKTRYSILAFAFTVFGILNIFIFNRYIIGLLQFIPVILATIKIIWDSNHPYIIYNENEIYLYPDIILPRYKFSKKDILSIEKDKDIFKIYLKDSKLVKIHLKMVDYENVETLISIINELKSPSTASNIG